MSQASSVQYECNGWHFYQLYNYFVTANDEFAAVKKSYQQEDGVLGEEGRERLEEKLKTRLEELFEKRELMDLFFQKENISANRERYENKDVGGPGAGAAVDGQEFERIEFDVSSTQEFVDVFGEWDARSHYVSDEKWHPTIETAKDEYSRFPSPYLVFDIATAIEDEWERSEKLLEDAARLGTPVNRILEDPDSNYHLEARELQQNA